MRWNQSHNSENVLPRLDLTKLKDMTEDDWQQIVVRVPFTGFRYLDYRDHSNVGRTTWVFKPRLFKTATESGLTMLRTLNFMQ